MILLLLRNSCYSRRGCETRCRRRNRGNRMLLFLLRRSSSFGRLLFAVTLCVFVLLVFRLVDAPWWFVRLLDCRCRRIF